MSQIEKDRQILKFLQDLTNWNFRSAAASAEDIENFPRQPFYNLQSLANSFDDLGFVGRPGSAFNGIPIDVKHILKLLQPWFKEHFTKEVVEGSCETFCGLFK